MRPVGEKIQEAPFRVTLSMPNKPLAAAPPSNDEIALTVFFDGACPLCDREVAFYRRRRGAEVIRWVDASEAPTDALCGLSRSRVLARFHVMDRDGQIFSGGAAFARLWGSMPGFRFIGRIGRVPVVTRLLDRCYDTFLKFRPCLQKLVS